MPSHPRDFTADGVESRRNTLCPQRLDGNLPTQAPKLGPDLPVRDVYATTGPFPE